MKQVSGCKHGITALMSFFAGAGDVWFSLRNTTYQNNSIVMLEDIGEHDDALLCITNYSACCGSNNMGRVLGDWFFPDGDIVLSEGKEWDIYITGDQMVARMNRRRGGMEGIYCCEIPDSLNVIQTLYIGVYSANTGEWCVYTLFCNHTTGLFCGRVICDRQHL